MNRFLTSLLVGLFFLAASPAVSFALVDGYDDSHTAPTDYSTQCVDGSYNCSCTTSTGSTNSTASSVTTSDAVCDSWCGQMHGTAYSRTCTLSSGRTNYPIGQGNQGSTVPTAGLSDAVEDTKADFLVPNLNVEIPGFSGFTTPTSSADGGYVSVNFLAQYINAVYGWAIAASALIAVVMMMLGGLQYVLSRGKSKYIEKAKTRITNAITGLVLLLAAYSIAYLIDPNTTTLRSLSLANVEGIEADLYGQGGEEESDAITPNNFSIAVTPITGDYISYVGSAADKFADKDVVTALQTAATAFYAATKQSISVTDGTRSIETQATLFYGNCLRTGTCSVPTCNPTSSDVVKKVGGKYVLVGSYASLTSASAIISAMVAHAKFSNCPHTSAVAIDAWGGPRAGDFKNDIALQQSLITAMIGAGFCRLSLEAWHFELEAKKVSTKSCQKSWSSTPYVRKDNGKQETPASTCKVWNFKKYYCATPKG